MAKAAAPHPDIERVLVSQGEIQAKVSELGQRITKDYSQRPPILVGILKGGMVFLADLMRQIHLPCPVDFMCLASYSGVASTGAVQVLLDLRADITDLDVVVVEDIVDTGLTLHYLEQNLRTRGPRSVELCTLLDKPDCRQVSLRPKYTGFTIPDQFVVGYGLDFEERYRNLPYIGVLKNRLFRERHKA